jgi:hypothetical protein
MVWCRRFIRVSCEVKEKKRRHLTRGIFPACGVKRKKTTAAPSLIIPSNRFRQLAGEKTTRPSHTVFSIGKLEDYSIHITLHSIQWIINNSFFLNPGPCRITYSRKVCSGAPHMYVYMYVYSIGPMFVVSFMQ